MCDNDSITLTAIPNHTIRYRIFSLSFRYLTIKFITKLLQNHYIDSYSIVVVCLSNRKLSITGLIELQNRTAGGLLIYRI